MKNYSLLLILPLLLFLTGCGQPGPLYLPTKPTPSTTEPPKDH